MTDETPKRVFLGSFEGGLPSYFEIPQPILERAGAQLDAERARREALAGETRRAALSRAKSMGKLRKLARTLFRGHRRIPQ